MKELDKSAIFCGYIALDKITVYRQKIIPDGGRIIKKCAVSPFRQSAVVHHHSHDLRPESPNKSPCENPIKNPSKTPQNNRPNFGQTRIAKPFPRHSTTEPPPQNHHKMPKKQRKSAQNTAKTEQKRAILVTY